MAFLSTMREHLLTTADAELWNSYLPAARSVFGSLGYARVCERFRNSSPRLYVLELGSSKICYPVLLRPLASLPFAGPEEGLWDSTTPDFTGPMMFGGDPMLADAFPGLRNALFRKLGVVAEFAHLHPWPTTRLLPGGCEFNREIVWIDVGVSPDQLWRSHVEHSCRQNINRAKLAGVKVYVASGDEDLREFCRIYEGTMQRRQALENYFYPFEFFAALRDQLPDNSRFTFAEYGGRIIAATLYLHDDRHVFSFLGGSDHEYQQFRPTNAVIWETICWAHANGKKRFVLGGGYRPEDGIFRFKATFSPLRREFYIYKRVHLEEEYEMLTRRCREHHGLLEDAVAGFPSYRFLSSRSLVRS